MDKTAEDPRYMQRKNKAWKIKHRTAAYSKICGWYKKSNIWRALRMRAPTKPIKIVTTTL